MGLGEAAARAPPFTHPECNRARLEILTAGVPPPPRDEMAVALGDIENANVDDAEGDGTEEEAVAPMPDDGVAVCADKAAGETTGAEGEATAPAAKAKAKGEPEGKAKAKSKAKAAPKAKPATASRGAASKPAADQAPAGASPAARPQRSSARAKGCRSSVRGIRRCSSSGGTSFGLHPC